jgi:GTP-binding protein HflX
MWDTGRTKKERAVLVTVDTGGRHIWSAEHSSAELGQLARSCGVKVVEEMICRRAVPTPTYFIGRGKVAEIFDISQESGADVAIFNEDLSSTQQRNLEEILDIKTIDRTQLILDIFAQRAKSMEGKIQVELAQLQYLLPRLTGKGIILSRLGGGIGTRGPGERKLEVDRRRIRERLGKLKKELRSLSRRRASLRAHRRHQSLATIAIVGYTNAGKSTLINRITHAEQNVGNKLFTTLDSVARKFTLPGKQKVLFSDTVGFVHHLPHHLIEAFKATLEEVKEADMLLHVLDVSSPFVHEQNEAVLEVLRELNAHNKPVVAALNKVDLLDNEFALKRYQKDFKHSVPVSARKGTNIPQLLELLSEQLPGAMTEIEVSIPPSQMHLVNLIYREGRVLKKGYQNGKIYLRARVPQRVKAKLGHNFIVDKGK